MLETDDEKDAAENKFSVRCCFAWGFAIFGMFNIPAAGRLVPEGGAI